MIFSKSHKFIFSRGIKTASTSLANELKAKANPFEQSFLYKGIRRIPNLSNVYPFFDFQNHPHTTLAKAQKIIPSEFYNSSIKFGVVRDPVSWMESIYKHWFRVYRDNKKINVNSFEDFIYFTLDNNLLLQSMQFINSYGELESNFVGNFHRMDLFIPRLSDELGFDINIKRLNVHPNKLSIDISSKIRSLIEKACELDYILFDFDKIYTDSFIAQAQNISEDVKNQLTQIWLSSGGVNYDPWLKFV